MQAPRGLPLELASASTDLIAYTQYHYNPGRDVVSRQEFIPEVEFKVGLESQGLRLSRFKASGF